MIEHHYDAIINTPIAKMGIRLAGESVTGVEWLPDGVRLKNSKNKQSEHIQSIIINYLEKGKPLSRIKMKLLGSSFQLKVWREMQKINMGSVVTYGDLARRLNTSSRAIGQACRTNPIVLFVPCHRVISASGIGGYMGKQNRTNIKVWLLEHEQTNA